MRITIKEPGCAGDVTGERGQGAVKPWLRGHVCWCAVVVVLFGNSKTFLAAVTSASPSDCCVVKWTGQDAIVSAAHCCVILHSYDF